MAAEGFRSAPQLAGDRLASGAVIVQPAAEAEGAYCITGSVLAPRAIIPPHVHRDEVQNLVVLSGSIGVWVDGVDDVQTAGGFFVRPRGLAHTLFNPTDEPAAFLEITSPGSGFETYLREADLLRGDVEAITALAARHGITFTGDPLTELRARYGLT